MKSEEHLEGKCITIGTNVRSRMNNVVKIIIVVGFVVYGLGWIKISCKTLNIKQFPNTILGLV